MRKIDQIEESEATGDIRAFYTDFKETVGASFVPTVFRSLARFPAYVLPAWIVLGPALGTIYARRAAAALRGTMAGRVETIVKGHATRPTLSAPARDEVRVVLETFADVLPMSWLGIVALGEAWNGRPLDGLARGASEETQPGPRGIPSWMPTIPLLDQEPDEPRVQAIFAATRTRLGRLAVPSIYRTLARWPDYLDAVWEQVIDPRILAGITAEVPRLTAQAAEAVHGLSCALNVNRSRIESLLPAGAADEIDTILNTYRKTMPETTLQILGLLQNLGGPFTHM